MPAELARRLDVHPAASKPLGDFLLDVLVGLQLRSPIAPVEAVLGVGEVR